jgi:Protein of unknown function (DUF1470).
MAAQQPAPFFIGDDLALDFLNSVAAPWGQEIEWLKNGGDLIAWLDRLTPCPRTWRRIFAQPPSSVRLMP